MGGNVFSNCIPCNQKHIPEIVKKLDKILEKLNSKSIPIGSSANPVDGCFSNDIDIIVDMWPLMNYFKLKDHKKVRKRLAEYFRGQGYEATQNAISVHLKFPFEGNYYQIDIMIVEQAETVSRLHIHKISKGSEYKGVHKHLALMYLSKKKGFLWSAFQGLYRRNDTGKKDTLVTRDLDQISYLLIGKDSSAETLDCFENIVAALPLEESREMIEKLKLDPSWK